MLCWWFRVEALFWLRKELKKSTSQPLSSFSFSSFIFLSALSLSIEGGALIICFLYFVHLRGLLDCSGRRNRLLLQSLHTTMPHFLGNGDRVSTDQSEASIQVTWQVSANQRPVLGHVTYLDQWEASITCSGVSGGSDWTLPSCSAYTWSPRCQEPGNVKVFTITVI